MTKLLALTPVLALSTGPLTQHRRPRPAEMLAQHDQQGKAAEMDVYEALYTTRAMRRVRPDPIPRVTASAQHLADHFEEVPLFLLAFSRGDSSGGSIFPAVWSAQLAARAHGVGSALTSVLGIHAAAAMEILAVPPGRDWALACCVSFGYPTGRWGVAVRRPVPEVTYRNSWGTDSGLQIPEPLWPTTG